LAKLSGQRASARSDFYTGGFSFSGCRSGRGSDAGGNGRLDQEILTEFLFQLKTGILQ
jgi:hypothetical protein